MSARQTAQGVLVVLVLLSALGVFALPQGVARASTCVSVSASDVTYTNGFADGIYMRGTTVGVNTVVEWSLPINKSQLVRLAWTWQAAGGNWPVMYAGTSAGQYPSGNGTSFTSFYVANHPIISPLNEQVSFSATNVPTLHIALLVRRNGGDIYVWNFEYCYDDTVTPTPSPSPTPTQTPVPAPDGALTGCLTMGTAATFRSKWTFLPPAAAVPGGGLSLPPDGLAQYIGAPLQPGRAYSIRIIHSSTSAGQKATLRIGAYSGVQVVATGAEYDFTIGPAQLTPDEDDPGRYTLSWLSADTEPDSGLVIEYLCFIEGEVAEPAEDTKAEVCFECSYSPVGDLFQDVPNLLGWLWCGLRRLVECWLMVLLGQIGQFVADIFGLFFQFIEWLWNGLVSFVDWLGGLVQWFGSAIDNIAREIAGVFRSLSLDDFLNSILGAVRGLGEGLLGALKGIIDFIGAIIQLIVAAVKLVIDFIGSIFGIIGDVVAVVGIVITSLVTSLAEPANATVANALVCADPNSLIYYPCLGFYVLDNTILSGPAYYVIIILVAVMSFDTVLWAIDRVRSAKD